MSRLSEKELAYPIVATIAVRQAPDSELIVSLDGTGVHPTHLADSLIALIQDLMRAGFVHQSGKCEHYEKEETGG